jgi:hypothetical protein
MTEFEKAALYVIDQLDEIDVQHAIYHMDRDRRPLSMVDASLCGKISDLMEEYADDNDLPEGWWLDYGDEDEVLTTALNLKADEK